MKFTATALVVAIAASFGVNPIRGQSLFDENGRELRGRRPKKLGKYKFTEPADFEGMYRTCHYSVIRSSSTGIQPGTFHACIGHENTPFWAGEGKFILQKGDEFGAYKGVVIDDTNVVVEFPDIPSLAMGGFQGFADGNTLSLNSFGTGGAIINNNGTVPEDGTRRLFFINPGVGALINNDTPDTRVCTLFDEGIMKCTTILIEYCSGASNGGFTAPFCQGREGQWLNTYSLKTISVKDDFECPEPPPGFCETKPFPDFHPLDPNPNNTGIPDILMRRLDDEEEESFHPCPILAAQMKMNG